jgi:hypothetical protein
MDERDQWRVPDQPWWADMLKQPPAPIASFKAVWGVDYDVIMGSLRQNSRESRARAALFEKLGSPITPEDVSAAVQIGAFTTAPFCDRLTIWKLVRLPWYRRLQFKFLVWRSKHRIRRGH